MQWSILKTHLPFLPAESYTTYSFKYSIKMAYNPSTIWPRLVWFWDPVVDSCFYRGPDSKASDTNFSHDNTVWKQLSGWHLLNATPQYVPNGNNYPEGKKPSTIPTEHTTLKKTDYTRTHKMTSFHKSINSRKDIFATEIYNWNSSLSGDFNGSFQQYSSLSMNRGLAVFAKE